MEKGSILKMLLLWAVALVANFFILNSVWESLESSVRFFVLGLTFVNMIIIQIPGFHLMANINDKDKKKETKQSSFGLDDIAVIAGVLLFAVMLFVPCLSLGNAEDVRLKQMTSKQKVEGDFIYKTIAVSELHEVQRDGATWFILRSRFDDVVYEVKEDSAYNAELFRIRENSGGKSSLLALKWPVTEVQAELDLRGYVQQALAVKTSNVQRISATIN